MKKKLGGLFITLQILKKMFADKDASRWPKILLIAAVIYLFVPTDLIPDFIPLVGLLDDLGILTLVITAIASLFRKFRKVNFAK